VGVLAGLGVIVAAPYRWSYVIIWVLLVLGANGMALGVRGQRLRFTPLGR